MEMVEAKLGRMVFARLFEDEELLETITQVAQMATISAGFFFVIGTLKNANLGFFREGEYETTEKNQPLEIVSCLGNISLRENKIFAHAHIAVSDDKGNVFGGHVMPGCIIGVTGELTLVEGKDIDLVRKFDQRAKLYMWSLKKQAGQPRKKRVS